MAGQIQLALKGLDDIYLTGEPKITYFRTVFNSFDQFDLKYHENQFYSSGVPYGGSQLCIIKKYGDIIRSNFLKVKLPSLFVTNSPPTVWCYPKSSKEFKPNIYLFDKQFNILKVLNVNDTCIYYNTSQFTWPPENVTFDFQNFKFNFKFECEYIGFDSTEEALFWGFKNYDSLISYTIFKNSYYIFPNRPTSEITIQDAGWLNSFSKYIRNYKPDVGSIFVDRVELYVGSQLIESIPGRYLSIYKDISIPEQLQNSLDFLEGAVPQTSTSELVYYVYLPVSVKDIPICTLYRQEVEIKIYFKNFTDLVDTEFLNIDTQFKITQQYNDKIYASVYDGSNVFLLSNNSIVNTPIQFDKQIIPRSVVRSNGYLYISTYDSNLIRYNTLTNSYDTYPFLSSYKIKSTIGLIYTTSLFNFTSDGIAQKLTTDINEYDLNINDVLRVHYYNTYIFLITKNKIYIYKNDLTFFDEIIVNSTPYLFFNTLDKLYMASLDTLYTYDLFELTSTSLPETNPTSIVYTKDTLFIFFKSGQVYENFTPNEFLTTPSENVYIREVDLNKTSVYVIGDFVGIKYKREITSIVNYRVFLSENKFIKGITAVNSIIFVSRTTLVYTDNQNFSPEIPLGRTLVGNVYLAYDNLNIVYIIDETLNISMYNIFEKTIKPLNYIPFTSFTSDTMGYDGKYLYIFPSNGINKFIKYNTDKNFFNETSYTASSIIDPFATIPKNLYIKSSIFDGVYIYALPTSNDGNIISINTKNQTYEIIDFILYGRDYIPQTIDRSIIIDKTLYLISSNGFYRYDTTSSGTYIERDAALFDNPLLSIYDKINSNIYIFSNTLSYGFMSIPTTLRVPTPTLYNSDIYKQITDIYSSYVEFGSEYFLIPKTGNVILAINSTNPFSVRQLQHGSIPNNSSLSLLKNDIIYIFPGEISSDTVLFNIRTSNTTVVQTPVNNYKTATLDGEYIYLTTSNAILRFNTMLDTFTDFSGYSEIPASPLLNVNDFVTYYESNVVFIGSRIVSYNVSSNTYTFTTPLVGNTVGVSMPYILRDTGTLYISNTVSTNIGSRNDIYYRPVDVSNNEQYVYIFYDGAIGKLDTFGDFEGTGYYSNISLPTPVNGNIVASTTFNNNIFIYFDSNSVVKYTNGNYSYANISSRNVFSKFSVYASNLILFGNNEIVNYNTNTPLTTSNLQIVPINIPNISSVSNADALYFTSRTSNTIVQYNPFTNTQQTYSTLINGFSYSYNFDSKILFFPSNSNSIVSYLSRTQNFKNFGDLVLSGQLNVSNIIQSNDNYILAEDQSIYKISENDTIGTFIGYSWSLINKSSLGYYAVYNSGANDEILSPYVNPNFVSYIEVDIYFFIPGTWVYNGSLIYKNDIIQSKQIIITQPEVRRGYKLYPPFSFNVGSRVVDSFIFIVPGSDFNQIIPTITSQNYIAAIDGTSIYNLDTNTLYGPNQTTDVSYEFYGFINVNYNSTLTSIPVNYQTTDQIERNVQVQIGPITVRALKVDEKTVNIYASNTSFISPATLSVGDEIISIPGSITYTFGPNNPSIRSFTFSNVYSTPRFTYIFNGSSDMIVYKNETQYRTPLHTFPVPGNINSMVYQGTGNTIIIYCMTDNNSNIYRFNEESDSSSYINFNIVKSLSGTFSNSSMISSSDGIIVITDDTIYGVGIQNKFQYNYSSLSSRVTNPVYFNSNLWSFSTVGDKILQSAFTKISDVSNSSVYNVLNVQNPKPFKYSFYDNEKYLYVVQTGNVLLYDNTSSFPTNFVNIPWDSRTGGYIKNQLSYIVSSNTNNGLFSYTNNRQRTYKYHTFNGTIQSNTVQVYGNIAYMLPINSSNIVAFDMNNETFSYIKVSDTPVVFYRPGVAISNVTYHSIFDDGRYISIASNSDVIQYDYISNTYLNTKKIVSNTAALLGSNILFFNNSNVITYAYDKRSYTYKNFEKLDGVKYYDGYLYASSNNYIYKLDQDLNIIQTITETPGEPGKSFLRNSNIAFSYGDSIIDVNLTTLESSLLKFQPFTHFTVDNDTFYFSNGTTISRGNVTNSNIVFYPKYTQLGTNFIANGNLYTLTNNSSFVIYNSNSLAFSKYSRQFNNAFVSKSVGDYTYYPPGLNDRNMQIYDRRLPFYDEDSYATIPCANNDYRSVITFNNESYFVPFKGGNLISVQTASETRGYAIPAGVITTSVDEKSLYLANASTINRFYFRPEYSKTFFGNNISFTKQTEINDIIFDGKNLYILGDYIYNLNTLTVNESDVTGIFQDLDVNIIDRNRYTSGYFDGRFLNLCTDTVKIYDVNPLSYPKVLSPSIITEYAYISDRDRNLLQNRELKHIVKQIQTVTIPTNSYSKIEFWNPMSEIVFEGYLDKAIMFLNGHEKFECDANFMKTVQILTRHSRRPTRNDIFTYSFATNPEDDYPDSYVNMSRIREKVVYVESKISSNVNVYGITHNIVKFRDGLGGLVFNNSSQ